MRRLLVTACLIASCSPGAIPATVVSTAPTSTDAVTTNPPVPGCPEGVPLIEAGALVDIEQPSTDSERIGSIGWTSTEACESFEIGLITSEGAPATTPPSLEAVFLRKVGVVRINLGLTTTNISDQLVETNLVDRLFVVRGQDGNLFVDFHLRHPALARVEISASPARILIDLEAGGDPYPSTPAVGTLTVVIEPITGTVAMPLTVEGYSRTFEANVVARIRQEGTLVAETFTTAADWSETWGSFFFEIDAPVTGLFELFIGEDPASGGPEQGVVIPLTTG